MASVVGNRAVVALLRGGTGRAPGRAGAGLDEALAGAIQQRRGGGTSLSSSVRREAESALGADLGHVRLHTDQHAHTLARNLEAKAFTVGGDIFFREGAYDHASQEGRELLGHELAHAVQQGNASGVPKRVSHPHEAAERESHAVGREFASPSQQPRRSVDAPATELAVHQSPAVMRWEHLGSWSWDSAIYEGRRVVIPLRVGSQAEWEEKLASMDNESTYREYLQGFLMIATDPSWATRTRSPMGWKNFRNDISRELKDPDIMAFMRALYDSGSDLQLPGSRFFFGMSGNSVHVQSMRRDLSNLIADYQGRLIAEQATRGTTMNRRGVREVADQGGARVRTAMLQNAAASAMKGLDLVATANQEEHPLVRETLRNRAFQTIENAAQTIRLTLQEHDARVAHNQAAAQLVFDTVWDMVPGGGALTSAAKGLLKAGFDHMLEEAHQNDSPRQQTNKMYDEFVKRTHNLVDDGHLDANDARGARNSYSAHRR